MNDLVKGKYSNTCMYCNSIKKEVQCEKKYFNEQQHGEVSAKLHLNNDDHS